MKHIFFKSTLFILVGGILCFSCTKDKDKPEPDKNTASDNANAQSAFDDIAKVTEDALNNNGGARMAAGNPISCATVDVQVLAQDSTKFIIDFPLGGSCNDGRVRFGTITAVMDGPGFNTPGSVLTITTSNYTIDGIKAEGKKVITCIANTNNHPVHTIAVSDEAGTGFAKITYLLNGNKTATWKSNRTRSLVSGGGNFNIVDNVYDISATTGIGNPVASGVNRDGGAYTVDFLSPVRVDFNCFANNTARYPTQGKFTVTPDGQQGMTVDYGNGACDNKIQITYYGKTYDFTLGY